MDPDQDLVDLAGGDPLVLKQLKDILPATESMKHDSHFDIQGRPRLQFPIPEPKWLVCDLPENTSKPMPEHSSLESVDLCYYLPQREPIREFHPDSPLQLRPGTPTLRFQHTSILRTCRRIFLEARDLLMKNATLRIRTGIWFFEELETIEVSIHSMGRMTRYAANRVTSLEIYLSQWELEGRFLCELEREENLRCVEDLRITIGKNGWRTGNEWREELEISGPQLTPYGDGRDLEDGTWKLMKDHMKLEEEHGQGRAPIPPIPYTRRQKDGEPTWGESLSMIPNLKRLTMDFEHSEDRFQELKELAQWAQRVWTFRLGGKMKGYYLSAKDKPIKMYSWRGLAPDMGMKAICPNEDCPNGSNQEDSGDVEMPECCAETYKRMEYGFGPRMYTFTVMWTAKKLDVEDGDDPEILGPDELKTKWPEVRRDALVPPQTGWTRLTPGWRGLCDSIPPALQDHHFQNRGRN
ncbi:hypothetical protein NCS57_01234700 [Fusarium keratoplasticum]|uniref:Uncharacterized protein n=1 Tax=Fusarium keratoplasticum TaxID=1328300 RepID=A0ACC0QH81_9HYPO|nr:hypothetical protein NCS57_01234700 [Fusarium keratoplasticum]KAI8654874.1 hypothetical protein NCS57_01234700 [Fusarium keratoplasticum]